MKPKLKRSEDGLSISIKLQDGNYYDILNDKRIKREAILPQIVRESFKRVKTFDTNKEIKKDEVSMLIDKEGNALYYEYADQLLEFPNFVINDLHPNFLFIEDLDVFCKKFGYVECLSRGVFVKKGKESQKLSANNYLPGKWEFKQEAKNSFIISEGKEYTFGLEFETSSGKVPPWVYRLYETNITCERDGSVAGGEYITDVLTGDDGFLELFKITKILSERTSFDGECGLHVHVGNALFNNTFIVLAYLFAIKVQDDLFNYFPHSRRNNEMCSKLITYPHVQEFMDELGFVNGVEASYEFLFEKMSNGRQMSMDVNKSRPHPGGRYTDRYRGGGGEIKKEYMRYKWFNLIPTSFDTRERGKSKPKKGVLNNGIPHTLEFRNHHATLDFITTSYWTLICMGMVSYIENYGYEIVSAEEILLEDVISKVYKDSKSSNIITYLQEQRKKFKKKGVESHEDLVENIDYSVKFTKGDVIKMLC